MTQQVLDIHAAFSRRENVEVIAGAGTGKTTLIVSGNHLLPHSTLFLAFNKAIADELSKRMPHRKCSTFHAIALSNLTGRIGRLKVDSYKYSNLAQKKFGYDREKAKHVASIVDFFQLQAEGCFVKPAEWTASYLAEVIGEQDLYSLDLDEGDTVDKYLETAAECLRLEAKALTALSFGDMLFFLVHYAHFRKWDLRDWDCLVVDEAQDVSPIRLEIIKLLSKRVIQVGDPRQAIYAFAGAMTSAMQNISNAYGCKPYPLSVTWRCSEAVIREASTVVGDFLKARPNAPEGRVDTIQETQLYQCHLDENSMVVSRTNAPLITCALRMFQHGIPFNLMSDFPEKLAKRTAKLADGITGMAAFRTAVNDAREKKLEVVKSKALIARINDEYDCILIVADRCSRVSEVSDTFRKLGYAKTGVLLATGHKSKGLEAQNVFILRPDLIPAPWVNAEDEEAMQQELNLKYVMITRAKDNLFYLEPETK